MLLGGNYVAKLADVGLAKFLHKDYLSAAKVRYLLSTQSSISVESQIATTQDCMSPRCMWYIQVCFGNQF